METCEHYEEAPAIKALGFRFKLTEVYLWDDGSKETREVPLRKYKKFSESDEDNDEPSVPSPTIDAGALPEDVELARQMSALGLPMCFRTSKKMTSKVPKFKRKGPHLKHSHEHEENEDELLELNEVSELEIVSPRVFNDSKSNSLCCMSMAIAVDVRPQCLNSEGEDSVNSVLVTDVAAKEQTYDATCDVLSNNGECDSGRHSDVPFKGVAIATTSTNLVFCRSLMECECPEYSSVIHNDVEDEKFCNEDSNGQTGVSESAEYSLNSEVLEPFEVKRHESNDDLVDWQVYWDSFYSRNYFYNVKTNVSTWFPPPGMEHLASLHFSEKSSDVIAEHTEMDVDGSFSCHPQQSGEFLQNDSSLDDRPPEEQLTGIGFAADSLTVSLTEEVSESGHPQTKIVDPATDELDSQFEPAMTKQKKKARRMRLRRKSTKNDEELQFQGISKEYAASIGKYWCQRYLLFSRFDDGVKMDEEGWFSVTPELVAQHHAIRCGNGTIIDCFTGVGGNAIQFAIRSKHVIAIDIDRKKIDYAIHNAAIYGVDDRIDFVEADFFLLAPKLKADTCFLSPPWGGPDYAKVKTYDIQTMLKPHNGYSLFNTAKGVAGKIVMFLPRNVDVNQLAELSMSTTPPWSLEVEKNYLNGKLKAITAYFSEPQ
ncbi:uncharacterized protein LOC120009377 isoform X2 [Tripterygium wilfordii]|uniref:uncharacterized protein LOC120009377 isoform X2 n=1 Tax=Tripterygium wilfordii TaxID=458696 RepID=UPI0018F81889|nr:uncharacterized protein LOC120009377 isoform X2 [Tripterygium wilfordii]